jgi:serine/threonine protein kinase
LHSKKIAHRDLKLSNMLLTEQYDLVTDFSFDTQKIADFGLSTQLDSSESERNTMCGTPNYISPEIVEGKGHGLATDIWSVGGMKEFEINNYQLSFTFS